MSFYCGNMLHLCSLAVSTCVDVNECEDDGMISFLSRKAIKESESECKK